MGAQIKLGIALTEQGLRTRGAEAARLLGEAVAVYRGVLEVLIAASCRSRARLPS